jgi:hypothetical protein
MGIDVQGVPGEWSFYWPGSVVAWNVREVIAVWVALRDVYIQPPDVILEGP